MAITMRVASFTTTAVCIAWDKLLWIKQLMREKCMHQISSAWAYRAGGQSPALSALKSVCLALHSRMGRSGP